MDQSRKVIPVRDEVWHLADQETPFLDYAASPPPLFCQRFRSGGHAALLPLSALHAWGQLFCRAMPAGSDSGLMREASSCIARMRMHAQTLAALQAFVGLHLTLVPIKCSQGVLISV